MITSCSYLNTWQNIHTSVDPGFYLEMLYSNCTSQNTLVWCIIHHHCVRATRHIRDKICKRKFHSFYATQYFFSGTYTNPCCTMRRRSAWVPAWRPKAQSIPQLLCHSVPPHARIHADLSPCEAQVSAGSSKDIRDNEGCGNFSGNRNTQPIILHQPSVGQWVTYSCPVK